MNKAIDVVKYRGKRIKVYIDDYGQSYYFRYKGKSYGCGTYNFDYLGEIVSVVDNDLDEVFYVPPTKEHHPSAKVYKRDGIWYCDYHGIDRLLVSYGDLLKNKDRPNRDMLVGKVHKIIDDIDKGIENDQLSTIS
jgi:hypothetical protein